MTVETVEPKDCKDGGSLYPSKSLQKNYKSIYKCRLCGKEFESDAEFIRANDFPTAPILKQHKCDDGRFGVGELQGTCEVKE